MVASINKRVKTVEANIAALLAPYIADEKHAKLRCEASLGHFVDDLSKFENGDSRTSSISGLNHYLDSLANGVLETVNAIDATSNALHQAEKDEQTLNSRLEPLTRQIQSAQDTLASHQLQRVEDEKHLLDMQVELSHLKRTLLALQDDRLSLDKTRIQRPKVLSDLRQQLTDLNTTHADLVQRLEDSMRLELICSKELDNISRIYHCFFRSPSKCLTLATPPGHQSPLREVLRRLPLCRHRNSMSPRSRCPSFPSASLASVLRGTTRPTTSQRRLLASCSTTFNPAVPSLTILKSSSALCTTLQGLLLDHASVKRLFLLLPLRLRHHLLRQRHRMQLVLHLQCSVRAIIGGRQCQLWSLQAR